MKRPDPVLDVATGQRKAYEAFLEALKGSDLVKVRKALAKAVPEVPWADLSLVGMSGLYAREMSPMSGVVMHPKLKKINLTVLKVTCK